jgi:DNA-nicking Smr family endonuclease
MELRGPGSVLALVDWLKLRSVKQCGAWLRRIESENTVMHRIPIEGFIDLHPFRPDETKVLVEEYLFQAAASGFREVRIIHGRGIGVQREIVHSILRSSPFVISFCDALDRGSTIVVLRTATPCNSEGSATDPY